MQLDSENFLESSNNPNVIGNRYVLCLVKISVWEVEKEKFMMIEILRKL